jgi:hypothetical protein
MYKKFLKELKPLERMGLKVASHLINLVLINVAFIFGFKYLSYPNDFYNIMGLLLVIVGFVFTLIFVFKVTGYLINKDKSDNIGEK